MTLVGPVRARFEAGKKERARERAIQKRLNLINSTFQHQSALHRCFSLPSLSVWLKAPFPSHGTSAEVAIVVCPLWKFSGRIFSSIKILHYLRHQLPDSTQNVTKCGSSHPSFPIRRCWRLGPLPNRALCSLDPSSSFPYPRFLTARISLFPSLLRKRRLLRISLWKLLMQTNQPFSSIAGGSYVYFCILLVFDAFP